MIDHNWNQSCVYELYVACYFCKEQTVMSRGHEFKPDDIVTCGNPECGYEIRLGKEINRQVNYGKKDPGTKVSRFFRRLRVVIYRKFFVRYE